MRKAISIDFDGVLHDYSGGWTGYKPEGGPVPGAVEFTSDLQDQGFQVIVSSCRALTDLGRRYIREWLDDNGFRMEFMHVTAEKPHAEFYIDDRAIRFEGDFKQVEEQMKTLQPWFKNQESKSIFHE